MIFNKKRTPVLPHLSSECERTTNYCILPYSQRCSNLKLLWSMMLKATFTNYFLDIKNTIFKEKILFLTFIVYLIRSLDTRLKKKVNRKLSHSLLRLSHWMNSKTTVHVWIRHSSPTDPNSNCAEKSRRRNSFLKNQVISTDIYLSFISHTPKEHTF